MNKPMQIIACEQIEIIEYGGEIFERTSEGVWRVVCEEVAEPIYPPTKCELEKIYQAIPACEKPRPSDPTPN